MYYIIFELSLPAFEFDYYHIYRDAIIKVTPRGTRCGV